MKLQLTLYPAFIKSKKFALSAGNIPNEGVRNAVFQHGIGDSLDRSPCGQIIYNFLSGNLIEAEVQDILDDLNDSEYYLNYRAIGEVAEAYAEWATHLEEKLDLGWD